MRFGGWFYGVKRHFQQYFSYIVAVGFIDGGNRSGRRKPPTCWSNKLIIVRDVDIYYSSTVKGKIVKIDRFRTFINLKAV